MPNTHSSFTTSTIIQVPTQRYSSFPLSSYCDTDIPFVLDMPPRPKKTGSRSTTSPRAKISTRAASRTEQSHRLRSSQQKTIDKKLLSSKSIDKTTPTKSARKEKAINKKSTSVEKMVPSQGEQCESRKDSDETDDQSLSPTPEKAPATPLSEERCKSSRAESMEKVTSPSADKKKSISRRLEPFFEPSETPEQHGSSGDRGHPLCVEHTAKEISSPRHHKNVIRGREDYRGSQEFQRLLEKRIEDLERKNETLIALLKDEKNTGLASSQKKIKMEMSENDSVCESEESLLAKKREWQGNTKTVMRKKIKKEGCKADSEREITPKVAYNDFMKEFVPHVNIAFGPIAIAKCTITVIVGRLLSVMDGKPLTPGGLLQVLRTALFCKKKWERKDVWDTDEGKEATKFRKRIMLCTLRAVQKDVFSVFHDPRNDDDNDNDEIQEVKPIKPYWLSKTFGNGTYITAKHAVSAVTKDNTLVDSKAAFLHRERVRRSAQPDRNAIASFAMDSMYQTLVSLCHDGRKNAVDEFFMSVGYLFIEWTSCPSCLVSDSNVILHWRTRNITTAVDEDQEIPDMIPLSDRDPNMDTKNKEAYDNFARKCTHVHLGAEHDVMVRSKGIGGAEVVRKRAGKKRETWRRGINLMDVAAYLIRGLSALPKMRDITFYDILGCHRDSVTVLHDVACVLRKVLSCQDVRDIHYREEGQTSADNFLDTQTRELTYSGENPCEAEKEDLKELFRLLMPTESKKNLDGKLWRATCTVQYEDFYSEHVDDDDEDLKISAMDEDGGKMEDMIGELDEEDFGI